MKKISCHRSAGKAVVAGLAVIFCGILVTGLITFGDTFHFHRGQNYTTADKNFPFRLRNTNNYFADEVIYGLPHRNISAFLAAQKLPWRDGAVPPSDQFFLDQNIVAPQYSILPAPCSAFPQPIYLVIIAVSRPNGFALREAVRATWGSLADPDCGVRLIFFLGKTLDALTQDSISKEAEQYGDILQTLQFEDNYRAQSLKSIYLFQWSGTFCSESIFTAKIDDDNWLNLERYVDFLKNQTNLDQIYGALFKGGTHPLRDPEDQYVSPRDDYPPDIYPDYTSGMLYAFPTKHLAKVVHIAKKLNVGINEDVFITGIVATAANLTRGRVRSYGWGHQPQDNPNMDCPKRDRICIHYSNAEWMYKLWNDPCHKYRTLCIKESPVKR